MTRIGDRNFLFTWRRIYAATQPNPEATAWQVDAVCWRRHRYTHTTPDHALTIDVHHLVHGVGRDGWRVMVVAEYWWDERHKPIRNNLWATHLSGSRLEVVEWFARQARTFDRDLRTTLTRDASEREPRHLEEFEE